jgi:hypothetical protein
MIDYLNHLESGIVSVRVTRKIIQYLEDMEKKAKQMNFIKNLKKEVETGANGTQDYIIKKGENTGKVAKK